MLPLEGLKVLDLSRLVPGPYATLVLADLGATVDKVEEPGTGDYLRHLEPLKGDVSGRFLALNRNKRSLTLDLKRPQGVAAIKRLVKQYDVLVESFRPGVMDKLGLGHAVLLAENPRLIVCALSGFGQTGPDRHKAGHDLTYLARAGVLGYGGAPGGPPALPGAQLADVGASLFGLVGLLAALEARHRTGQGRVIDVALCESATAFIHMHLGGRMELGAEGRPLSRGIEPLNGGFPSYGVYRTKDGRYLAVGALEPKFFSGLAEVLGEPELVDGAWDTGAGGEVTRARLAALIAKEDAAHWKQVFATRDLCVEVVSEGDEVLHDAQLQARGLFEGGHLQTPLHFGPVPQRAAPGLGQHSEEVLREAGFSAEEIAELLR